MTDLESLYRVVLASPEADVPRLMFADELEATGDADRAAFVRIECEVVATRAKPPRCKDKLSRLSRSCFCTSLDCPVILWQRREVELVARRQALVGEHRERWQVRCAACGGGGYSRYWDMASDTWRAGGACRECRGTGFAAQHFHRGLLTVVVARVSDLWTRSAPAVAPDAWEPTAWLCAAIREHYVAVVIPRGAVRLPSATSESQAVYRSDVPPQVWAHMGQPPDAACAYGEAAITALGRATVRAAVEWMDSLSAAAADAAAFAREEKGGAT